MIAICWQAIEEVASSSFLGFSLRIDSNPFCVARTTDDLISHVDERVSETSASRCYSQWIGLVSSALLHTSNHRRISIRQRRSRLNIYSFASQRERERKKAVLSSPDSVVSLNGMKFQLLFVVSDNEIISDALETCACLKKKRKTCRATCLAFFPFSMPLLNIFFIDTQR